jgi:hypothetical protein
MIEVVKSHKEIDREVAEDNVAWALNAALEVVNNINVDVEEGGKTMSNSDALFVASMLLSELKNTNS